MATRDIVVPALLVAWLIGSIWIHRCQLRASGHRSIFARASADAAAGRDPMQGRVTRYEVAAIALLMATGVLVLLAERFLA